MTSGSVWMIFLLPVISFLIISFFIRPFVKPESRIAGYVTIAAIGTSLALSLLTLRAVMGSPEHELAIPEISWLAVGDLEINVGLMVDSLTAVMLVVVTTVSLMVQIYSLGYMQHEVPEQKPGDRSYHRYYAWMSLFTASMLGVVLSNSLLLIFVFWELVGLCSYLLIGFWFHRPSAANAAKKAFIVTRLGDFGFLAAILLIYVKTGTFNITELQEMAIAGALAGTTLTWAAVGIFSGAVGKSAQFPLHVWLPDAMEGPTPVSALIHAATMVAAGVFLVARTFPLFVSSATAVTTVAFIGAFTAIFAATMGLVMNDIKRVVAYSTISQLGYMMLGLGAAGLALRQEGHVTLELAKAATAIGIFHLFNHAFFKALLFLGSGSVNHATGTFDMRQMGGLRKAMPWTYFTFVIAALSLAGIWPLAGFWSKDEILAVAWDTQKLLFVLVIITVLMTAFYIFRVVFLTFGGEYRGVQHGGGHSDELPVGPELEERMLQEARLHGLHESPAVMVAPMVILAVLAVFSGFWNVSGGFNAFMGHGETKGFLEGLFGIFAHPLPWIALFVALLGIFLAYAIYGAKWISAEGIGRTFKPLYTLFYRKYFFDELYENVIVRITMLKGIFAGLEKIDTHVVDGTVNGLANSAVDSGNAMRRAQTGQLQLYGVVIGLGILVIVVVLFLAG
ncbi:MAG: NADH-quinone oxidoreductase subunit L [Chloroflexi bacterium]|nr:NADH-quinone oxidoreductase subunit L [Chloroflexota bacterium]